jgi:hypothetical protein
MEEEPKARFMDEIVTPRHSCSTWNERRGYLTASLLETLFLRGGLCNRWILAGQIFPLCVKNDLSL